MDIRSYTKQELALLYFPDSSPVVASAHLMRWICRITQKFFIPWPTLMPKELLQAHYQNNRAVI